MESVEQLLGRKYRLVCDLAAATTTSRNEAVGGLGGSANGNTERDVCGTVKLTIPYASYQNQPPANGQYRALVKVMAGAAVAATGAVDMNSRSGADGVEDEAIGQGAVAAAGSSGQACALVTLSDAGLEVELGEASFRTAVTESCAALLLVDFDACG